MTKLTRLLVTPLLIAPLLVTPLLVTPLFILCTTAVMSSPSLCMADDGKDNLDDQLLDELDSDLLEGLEDIPEPLAKPEKKSVLDQQLLQDLGGEDIGEEPDPLMLIARRMRDVEQRIGEQDTSQDTQQLQKLIISDLAQIIEQLNKKCQGQSKSKSSSSAGTSKSKPGSKASDTPSSDSTNRREDGSAEEVAAEDVQEMLKKVWGQLPPKVRQQINSASIEEFLPKYQKLIETFYQRLAEEESSLGSQF